jgi:hypothetical protein
MGPPLRGVAHRTLAMREGEIEIRRFYNPGEFPS